MNAASRLVEVRVPDMGNFKDVAVIDVLVKPGETIEPEAPLVTLETEKATMDVPSTASGVVEKVHVAKGGKVSPGDLVVTVRSDASARGIAAARRLPQAQRRRSGCLECRVGRVRCRRGPAQAGALRPRAAAAAAAGSAAGSSAAASLLEASSPGRTPGRAGKAAAAAAASALCGERPTAPDRFAPTCRRSTNPDSRALMPVLRCACLLASSASI